jgi:EAL domain-containing protein (putative c-di-GMP-specific phosphodiesterase class I)
MLRVIQAEAAWTRGPIGLNLTLATLQGPSFRNLADVCRPERRRNVVIEIHRGDLLSALSSRGLTLEALREQGWRLALDGVTPAVLPFLNLAHPVFDFVKVVLIRDELKALSQRECLAALRAVDREKLVFARCDDPGAIDLARALGVTRLQGDLVERLAAEAAGRTSAAASA